MRVEKKSEPLKAVWRNGGSVLRMTVLWKIQVQFFD